jgi:hypothetical protein
MLYLESHAQGMSYILLYARDLLQVNPQINAEQLVAALQKVADGHQSVISSNVPYREEPKPLNRPEVAPRKIKDGEYEASWRVDALKLSKDGKGPTDIARELKVDFKKVYDFLYRHGQIKPKKKHWSKRTKAEMVNLMQGMINLRDKEGATPAEISKKFKLDSGRVAALFARAEREGIKPSPDDEI